MLFYTIQLNYPEEAAMRLATCCVAALLAFQVSSAQITVQQSVMQSIFGAGNPLSVYFGVSPTDTTLDIGLQGTNRVYDFSTVSFELFKVDTVKQVSDIPYLAARFPGNAVALTFDENEGSFNHPMLIFENDEASSVGEYEQITPDSIVITHHEPYERFLKFPITYGDSLEGTSTITDSLFVMGELDSAQSNAIPSYYIVDGWGTLKLSDTEEYPCLRIRWYEEIPDENPETPDYHYMSFRYVTADGVFMFIDTRNDQPVEGEVALDGGILLFRSSSVTSVSNNDVPEQFTLSQNYPNPFNPVTNFEMRISERGMASLKIYDIFGREIATLINRVLAPGIHRATWDATGFPSGVYFYTLRAGGISQTRKLMLVK